MTTAQAIIIAIIEGLTEFLPISSTGHLLIVDEWLNFQSPAGKAFEIAIQSGAILAVCFLFWQKLWSVASHLHSDAKARLFVANVLLAFLPAAIIGAIFHDWITHVLFSLPVVAGAMIVGGIAILLIERLKPAPDIHSIDHLTPKRALLIGACQCIAMIPGMSRSGATIMGSLLLGVDRKTAAEFSFFLAIPTIFGATAYELYKNHESLTMQALEPIAIGFFTAFISAWIVIRWLMQFISKHGFEWFAWYRIAAGIALLLLMPTC